MFFPYKHQFFDLVPSGSWLCNPHLCLCGSKMLNTISMEWFLGSSGEQLRKEPQFYHFNQLKQTQFQPNLTFHTFPVLLQQPPAEYTRGTGTCFRFSLNSEGKGHCLQVCLLWDMPKLWSITWLESRGCLADGCLTDTPQALVKLLFQKTIFDPRVIPGQPASLLSWLLGHLPVRVV